MEKSKVLKKVRGLAQAHHMFPDRIAVNQAEIAVIMQTFGMSWDELKKPSNTFSLHYKMVQTESDLMKELEGKLKTLKLAKEKGLQYIERDMKLMIKGFIDGVRFFNKELSDEFALIADKI